MKTDDCRLWGVSRVKEKRAPKKNLTDADVEERLSWGEPIENITAGYYTARILLLRRQRHIGVRRTAVEAGRLYDDALFHLWGFVYSQKARFNFYFPYAEETGRLPVLTPEVRDLKTSLLYECRRNGLDFSAFDYAFPDYQNHNQQPITITT